MAAFAAFLAPFFWWFMPDSVEAKSTVLDPSLYLLPSPPFVAHGDPAEIWSQPSRVTRDVDSLATNTISSTDPTTEGSDSMEGAETFWPRLRPAYGGIHIPLTFSVSGTYGSGYGYGSGVLGSRYASTLIGTGVAGSYGSVTAEEPAKSFGEYGKSALAGSSYGTYGSYPGVRVYGSIGKTGWSGWGNGKWGHYGKG